MPILFPDLMQTVQNFNDHLISEERKSVLKPLIAFIQEKVNAKENVNLNFICTHNSRRSHLAQIWAQTMATYFDINKVNCFSGGTEATALFPMVAETLSKTGFQIIKLSKEANPVYAFKYNDISKPIICFSKKYDHDFNATSKFAAIMTCNHADQNCPLVLGAEKRIPVTYEDPKAFDETPRQKEMYTKRSMQIASEMYYVFSKIQS